MKAWIYFARFSSAGPIKIGRTHYNPRDRVRNIDCNGPFRITLLGAMLESSKDEEQQIHKRLRSHRVRGEWFEAKAALRARRQFGVRVLSAEALKHLYRPGASRTLMNFLEAEEKKRPTPSTEKRIPKGAIARRRS